MEIYTPKQKNLAIALGVSPATVSRWLKGRRPMRLTLAEWQIVADHYGCTVADLREKGLN